MLYINIHTHQEAGEANLEIINKQFPFQFIQNDAKYLYSMGVHPWNIDMEIYKNYYELLLPITKNSNVVLIGETGLDKFTDTPLDIQKETFKTHIHLSEELKKPLIIHCVRYFNEVLHLKNELKPTMPWIFHGFNNKMAIAEQLLKHDNIYLSFGKALFDENSNAVTVIKQVDLNRFFLETDDSEISIKQVYEKAAEHLNLFIEEIDKIQQNNLKRLFEKSDYSICIQGQNYSLVKKD